MNHKYPFVLCAYDSEEKMHQAEKLIDDADVAIYGSCPDSLIVRRTSKGKLCFKFSERYFKEGTGLLQIPHNFASAWKHLKPFEKGPLYFCSATPSVLSGINRIQRWSQSKPPYLAFIYFLRQYIVFSHEDRGAIRNKHPFGHEADFRPSQASAI